MSMWMDGRLNLYNLEHEKAVLSALMVKAELIDDNIMTASDMFDEKHKMIFRAINQLVNDDITVNYLSVTEALKNTKVNAADIAKMDLPTIGNFKYYAESVRELSQKRALRIIGLNLQEAIETKDVNELLESIDRKLTVIYDHDNNSIQQIKGFLHKAIEDIEIRYNKRGKLMGIPTGLDLLDNAINGWQNGMFYIIAARPSIGKTAMALTMASVAATKGYLVGFFSCEMSGQQLAFRLIAAESRINISNLTSGFIMDKHFLRIIDAGNDLNSLPILVDDTPNPTLAHIKAHARKMKRQDVKLIFIDYLTLIKYGSQSTPRPERVGEIGKQLKQLSRELNIPIVVLSQVNRDAEGKEPTLANLRQSGEIEEDVDCLIFLHRERSQEATETDVIIAKQRQGPTTRFKCVFLPQYVRFENMAAGIE